MERYRALARDDSEWLEHEANDRYSELCVPAGPALEFERSALNAQPAAIRRRVLLRALRSQAGGREIGFDHVEIALEVAAGQLAAADLPGIRLELRGGKLVLVQQDAASK